MTSSSSPRTFSEVLADAAALARMTDGLPTRAPSRAAMIDTPFLRALTGAIARGDEDAFSRFHDLYGFRIYRFSLLLVRGDESQAREVAQAVLIKVARRLEIFDDEARLWAWLCRLARNAFIDQCRQRAREQRLVPLESLATELSGAPAPIAELAALLDEALASLSAGERELIQSAYVDERRLQELADQSSQSYKAVESRLARLRRKLKARLIRMLRQETPHGPGE